LKLLNISSNQGAGGMTKNYITVEIEGLQLEKFINLAVESGISLWNVKRISFTNIKFNMYDKDFKMIRKIAKKTNCRVKILNKKGPIFLFKKLHRRIFFIVGLMCFSSLIYIFSNIIWSIQISGNKYLNESLILKSLSKSGLKIGAYKKKLNLRDIENSVLKDIKEISIITITLDGTKAKVEVVERTMPPTIIDTEKPMNIVAEKDGIITKVIALKGQKIVREGDYVKKGQVLISGIITDSQNIPLEVTRALGEVYARTWYESIKEVYLNYKYFERTGREVKKVYFILPNNKIIDLKPVVNNFTLYDKIINKENVKVFGIKLPIVKVTEHYYEKVEKNKKLSYNEALEMALKEIDKELSTILPKGVKILDEKYDKIITKDKVRIRKLVVIEEKISKEVEIK